MPRRLLTLVMGSVVNRSILTRSRDQDERSGQLPTSPGTRHCCLGGNEPPGKSHTPMLKGTHRTLARGERIDLSSVVPASVLFLPEIRSRPGIDCALHASLSGATLLPPGNGDLAERFGLRVLTSLLIDYQVSAHGTEK